MEIEIEMEVHTITEDEMPDAQRQATERVKQKFAAGLKTTHEKTENESSALSEMV